MEDEVALAEGIARGLEAEGFGVDVVHDGDEGYWRAHEHQYAAIVLDLLLPGMNGFKVCKALRAEGNWTPILVLTAKSGEYDEAEALDTGADDFLSKPFSFVVLRAPAGPAPPRQHAVATDGLRWARSSSTPTPGAADRQGEEVPLTARRFAVLEGLPRRQGGVASKQELLDEVWGSDFPGDLHRRGVHPLPPQEGRHPLRLDTIETVRSVGYRVVPDVASHRVARRRPWCSVRGWDDAGRHRPRRGTLALGVWALVSLVERQLTDQVREAPPATALHDRGRFDAASRSAWSVWRRSGGPGCR